MIENEVFTHTTLEKNIMSILKSGLRVEIGRECVTKSLVLTLSWATKPEKIRNFSRTRFTATEEDLKDPVIIFVQPPSEYTVRPGKSTQIHTHGNVIEGRPNTFSDARSYLGVFPDNGTALTEEMLLEILDHVASKMNKNDFNQILERYGLRQFDEIVTHKDILRHRLSGLSEEAKAALLEDLQRLLDDDRMVHSYRNASVTIPPENIKAVVKMDDQLRQLLTTLKKDIRKFREINIEARADALCAALNRCVVAEIGGKKFEHITLEQARDLIVSTIRNNAMKLVREMLLLKAEQDGYSVKDSNKPDRKLQFREIKLDKLGSSSRMLGEANFSTGDQVTDRYLRRYLRLIQVNSTQELLSIYK